jgi:hypothetical protein
VTTRAARLTGGAALLFALAAAGLLLASLRSWRQSLLSRVVDRGACASSDRLTLVPPTPPGSRELFRVTAACRAQVRAMLRAATHYSCRSNAAVSVCEHPLNAADDTTYVRAVIGRDHILLEAIPT